MDELTKQHEALLYEYVFGDEPRGLTRWHEAYRVGFERSAYVSWWFEQLTSVFPRTARALRRILSDRDVARRRLRMSPDTSAAARCAHFHGMVEDLSEDIEHGSLLRDLVAYEMAIARVREQPVLGRASLSRHAVEPTESPGPIAELEVGTTLPEVLPMAAGPEELLELYADFRPRNAAVYYDSPLATHVLVTFETRDDLAGKILFGRVP